MPIEIVFVAAGAVQNAGASRVPEGSSDGEAVNESEIVSHALGP